MDTFGKRLKAVRERLNRSVIGMAALVGVQRAAWHSWERDASMPTTRHLKDIAGTTGASLDWIILGKGDPP